MLSDPRPHASPGPPLWPGGPCAGTLSHGWGTAQVGILSPSPHPAQWQVHGGRSGRLPGGHHVPQTGAPPTSLLDVSKGGTQTLTSYPGSPRGPGGPLAGCTAERTVSPRETLPGGPRPGRGWGGHTHLALEGAALPEEGQSDTSESRGAAAAPPMPAGAQRARLGRPAGRWGPVVTPWAVGEGGGGGRGSYHLFHIIFLKMK